MDQLCPHQDHRISHSLHDNKNQVDLHSHRRREGSLCEFSRDCMSRVDQAKAEEEKKKINGQTEEQMSAISCPLTERHACERRRKQT